MSKKPTPKNASENPDFRFLVRLVNTDLDGKKKVAVALRGITGVSDRMATIIAREAELPADAIIGNLSDAEIASLGETIEDVGELVPAWMRNRRADPESGEDLHLIGTEIPIQLREDLNNLKKIRSWKGLRHERKLPVRGQRTKANGRTGSTVGVQRKK